MRGCGIEKGTLHFIKNLVYLRPIMDYAIHIGGVAAGKSEYEFEVKGELFREFGNTQVLDADIVVKAVLEKGSGWMNLVCAGSGTVVVECDRCLEELELPIAFESNLAIRPAKLGEEPEVSDEFIVVDPSEAEVDIKQFIYDTICVNIPLKRVHRQGDCNPQMEERLKNLRAEDGKGQEDSDTYSPFSALKDLLGGENHRDN